MSMKKFEAQVDYMIHKAEFRQLPLAKSVGDLLKITYSELMGLGKTVPEKGNFFVSRIAKKNVGKRIRPTKSRF